MEIRMVGASDIGRARKTNQDSFYFDPLQGIAIVADGIGGRKGGEQASKTAVEGMQKLFVNNDSLRIDEISPFLLNAVDKVNDLVIQRGQYEEKFRGMGTTLEFLLFVGDRLYIAHVGDSRTYLYDRGHLWQLTIDHNVETFLQRGWLGKEAVSKGAKKGALVRSLGIHGRCEADVYEIGIRPQQIYLTCSDGLYGMVSDQRIAELIGKYEHALNKLPRALIDEANRNGGRDNITVVVSKIEGG